MNKKIRIEIAVGIIVALAVIIGGYVWMQGKKEIPVAQPVQVSKNTNDQQADTSTADAIKNNISEKSNLEDKFLFKQNSDLYQIDIATKRVTKQAKPIFERIAEFSGLPKKMDNKKIRISNNVMLISNDNSKAIVVSAIYDYGIKSGPMGGFQGITSADEFICDATTKSCAKTDIFTSISNVIGLKENWYDYDGNNPEFDRWYEKWDSQKNLIYGSGTGLDGANGGPYVFDIADKTLMKTSEKYFVSTGGFSPSLSLSAGIDYYNQKLILFKLDDLSKSYREYDLPGIRSAWDDNGDKLVSWSQDEKKISIQTNDEFAC